MLPRVLTIAHLPARRFEAESPWFDKMQTTQSRSVVTTIQALG